MSTFSYEAVDAQGQSTRGLIDADTPESARHALRQRGLVPMQVKRAAQPLRPALRWLRYEIWPKRILGAGHLVLFTRQLAELVAAGLPVVQALGVIAEEAEIQGQKQLLLAMHAQVLSGSSLAHAMERAPLAFSDIYRAVIAAGEAGGRLEQILGHLASDLEAAQALREKLISATLYPTVVGVVALGLVGFLLTTVVPQMAEVFVGRQRTLPTLTVWLLDLSTALRQLGGWALLLLACLALIVRQALQRPSLRHRADALWLQLPMVGSIARSYSASRFAATLALLVDAGLPILPALQSASQTLNNRALRGDALKAVRLVREGAALASALGSSSRFPKLLLVFVRLGEQTGALPDMLDRVAQQLSAQVQRRAMRLATIVEPLLITALGGVVMLIVLAVLLPIMSLQQLKL